MHQCIKWKCGKPQPKQNVSFCRHFPFGQLAFNALKTDIKLKPEAMLRPSCKGLSLFMLVLILFVITIHSRKKPPKAKTRGRAAAVLNQESECGPTEAYYNESDKCLVTGIQGVCPTMMKFYADAESEGFGDCDCDENDCSENQLYLYWTPENRCYPGFARGPCAENEWLVQGPLGDGVCQINPCAVDHETGGNGMSSSSDDNSDMKNQTEHLVYGTVGTLCTCARMDNLVTPGSDSESNDMEKSNGSSAKIQSATANSQRIYKSDTTCVCKTHQVQYSASTRLVNWHLFPSYMLWFSLAVVIIIRNYPNKI